MPNLVAADVRTEARDTKASVYRALGDATQELQVILSVHELKIAANQSPDWEDRCYEPFIRSDCRDPVDDWDRLHG
jgi:hypothetical protein